MSFGQGNIILVNNPAPSAAGVTNLINGLHLNADVGKLGGTLVEDTIINLGAGSFFLVQSDGFTRAAAFQNSGIILLGAADQMSLDIDPVNDLIRMSSGDGPLLDLDYANQSYKLGDIGGIGNATYLEINDLAETFNVFNHGAPGLLVDFSNNQYAIGDFINSFVSLYMVGGTGPQSQITLASNSTLSTSQFNLVCDDTNDLNTLRAAMNAYGLLVSNSSTNTTTKIGNVDNVNSNHILIDEIAATTQFFIGGIPEFSISSDGIATNNINFWKLQDVATGAATFDATRFINAVIDGVAVKLAVAT